MKSTISTTKLKKSKKLPANRAAPARSVHAKMVKAAKVELVSYEKTGGGYVTAVGRGAVAPGKAAGEAGYKGQIPSNVEAAVWGQKRLIVIAARAWRDRNNGAALVTHEVAHLFWDTLPTAAKTQLRALHAVPEQHHTHEEHDGGIEVEDQPLQAGADVLQAQEIQRAGQVVAAEPEQAHHAPIPGG